MSLAPEGSVPVTFEPGARTVWVPPGSTVLAAARRVGVSIPAPCGGRGICGGCGVRVLDGRLDEPDAGEMRGLGFVPSNVRLACRARVVEAVTLRPVVSWSSAPMEAGGTGGPGRRRIVAAVDLGTTSVAAVVIDAESGVEVGRGSVPNHQASWGADVVSRIQAAAEGDGADLVAAAEASVLDALGEACDRAGSCVSAIERLVLAGNTAMSSILLRADVRSLAGYPFALPYEGAASVPPESALVTALSKGAATVVLPALGGFIGGDITAGLIATGYADADGFRLLLDVGTNAEIVCVGAGDLVGASAAAGPAFEGFGIRCGGPAAAGAIQRVTFDGAALRLDVIGGGAPGWLCGSGLVSAIALLRRLGHIDPDGGLTSEGPLEAHFLRVEGVLSVGLSDSQAVAPAAEPFRRVVLTQQDIRAFQLAKGAVLTAVEFVLDRVGVAAAGLSDVAVAGAFGGALDVGDLVELGVVPERLKGLLRVVGNASLDGAAMVALDEELEQVAESLRARFAHVDLASEPSFGSAFVGSLALEARRAP